MNAEQKNLEDKAGASRLEITKNPDAQLFTAESSQQADWVGTVANRVLEMDKRFRSFVQENPVATALCAVGAGLAVSLILNKLSGDARTEEGGGNGQFITRVQ